MPIADVVAENAQLRAQLQRTEMERDILKKAMAWPPSVLSAR